MASSPGRPPLRVFLTYTPDLETTDGSYVAAVRRAIRRSGHAVVDMTDVSVAQRAQTEVETFTAGVLSCDVYVGVLGTRYGSPVHGRPGLSATELEFEAASNAGLPLLLFALDAGGPTAARPVPVRPSDHIDERLQAFKDRATQSGLRPWLFATPAQLEREVEDSLREVTEDLPLDVLPAGSAVFVGRDLAQLDDAVCQAPVGAVLAERFDGLGGAGKTELAIHYARAYRHRYRSVWWLRADTAENVSLGLAAMSRRLGSPQPTGSALSWAADWLRRNGDWLLVLDDVVDVADVEPLLAVAPAHGRVLITARRGPAADSFRPYGLAVVRVDGLDQRAGSRLLTRLSELPDSAEAQALAGDLAGWPLALHLAAAHLRHRQDLGFGGLRRRLAVSRGPAFDLGRLAPPERAVDGVWRETVAALVDRSPLAVRMLLVMAWLAPDPLPEDVLRPLAETGDQFESAVTVLTSYHVVVRADHLISMHRVFQVAAHAHSGIDGWRQESRAAAGRLLLAALPESPFDVARWRVLLPHVEAVLHPPEPRDLNRPLLEIGRRAAVHRYYEGRTDAAVTGLERVLADFRLLAGDKDPSTVPTAALLARMYQAVGRTSEAIVLLRRVLDDTRRSPGADELAMFAAADGLAGALVSAGQPEEAIVLQRTVVDGLARHFGVEAPATLTSRRGLADAYAASGRLTEATELYERVVAESDRVLGPDHPETWHSRGSLAGAHASAGRFAHAIALFQETTETMERTLDQNDPTLLGSRHQLALAYGAHGDLEPASRLYEDVIARCQGLLRTPGADATPVGVIRSRLDHACADYWQLLRRADEDDRGLSLAARRTAVGTILRNVTRGPASPEVIETPVGVVTRYGFGDGAFVLVDPGSEGNVVSWTGSGDAAGFFRLCSALAADAPDAAGTVVVDGAKLAGAWPIVAAQLTELLRDRSWDHCEFIRLDLPVVDVAFHGVPARGSHRAEVIVSAVSADRFGPELELIARHTADPAVYLCVLDVAPLDRDAMSRARSR